MVIKMRNKKLIITIIILVILLTTFILTYTYSRYIHSTQIIINDNTGTIKLDMLLDTNDSYIENNVAYFRLKVFNTENGITTDTNINYTVNITNIDNSNGIYYLIDDEGNTSTPDGTYLDSIQTQTYTFGTQNEYKEFKVFVKSNDGKESNIKFNINIDAIQKE